MPRETVWTAEQVARGSSIKQRSPALAAMSDSIVSQVAALAKSGKISTVVVAWVLIEVCRR